MACERIRGLVSQITPLSVPSKILALADKPDILTLIDKMDKTRIDNNEDIDWNLNFILIHDGCCEAQTIGQDMRVTQVWHAGNERFKHSYHAVYGHTPTWGYENLQ